jgi:chromosome segregation ATPase
VVGLEEKLRSMAFQNKEMQKKIDMLRGSLLGSEERIGELLKERETLRQRVDQLEEELENATAVLEEIANLQ